MLFNDFNVLYQKYKKILLNFQLKILWKVFFVALLRTHKKGDCQMYYNILGYSFFALDRNMIWVHLNNIANHVGMCTSR